MGTLCQRIRLGISALWRSIFLRGSVSSHSEHFQLIALSALALFAVLVAGLASAPGCTAGFAACCPADSAAQQSARSPPACDVFFFFLPSPLGGQQGLRGWGTHPGGPERSSTQSV